MNVFVTGTDTGVGKTYISAAILRALVANGQRALGMKPIASGASRLLDQLRNEDVEQLAAASNVAIAPHLANPYLFEPPASPHIAADHAGTRVAIDIITTAYGDCAAAADFVVVEGVGGWCVPINETQTVADLALALNLPVILVVGIRLGCINHALLTASAIGAANLPLAGWIANILEPAIYARADVIDSLVRRIQAPLFGIVDWQSDATTAGKSAAAFMAGTAATN